jgi:hypothetical protein
MSGNGGGSFAAILLSIPLTAVALMSVFGIPQLSKVVSSIGGDSDDELDPDEFDSRSRSKRRASREDDLALENAEPWDAEEESDSSFGRSRKRLPRPSPLLESSSRTDEGEDGFSAGRKSLLARDSFEVNPDGADEEFSGDEFGESPKRDARHPFAPTDQPTGETLRTGGRSNFAAAIQRLTALGVARYHLEPGLAPGDFLFVCIVPDKAASGPIHRFESEGADPAAAVDDVIQQITAWRSEGEVRQTVGVEPPR